MKNKTSVQLLAVLSALSLAALPEIARAAVYWDGTTSSDWAEAANWMGGLPSDSGVGDTIINVGSPFTTPVVSTMGNTTSGQIYLSIGAGLSVVNGGQLDTLGLITGNFGNSATLSVSGGLLDISGFLNMGNNGNLGSVDISGGRVSAGSLSINTTAGTTMDISGAGSFTTAISQLGNVDYWVAHNVIRADGGAGSINIDTTSNPGFVVLSVEAVPEPGDLAVIFGGVAMLLSRRPPAKASR